MVSFATVTHGRQSSRGPQEAFQDKYRHHLSFGFTLPFDLCTPIHISPLLPEWNSALDGILVGRLVR